MWQKFSEFKDFAVFQTEMIAHVRACIMYKLIAIINLVINSSA